MDERDPLHLSDVEIAARFACQLIGADGVAAGPPPADSPLGRVLALTRALKELDVPESVRKAAIGAMWTEEWRAQGLNVDSRVSPWDD